MVTNADPISRITKVLLPLLILTTSVPLPSQLVFHNINSNRLNNQPQQPLLLSCDATRIKWTPANDNNNKDQNADNAALAPRSQKYWDEHNIKRPDYGKTDEELRSERSSTSSSSSISWWRWAMLGIIGGLAMGIQYYRGPRGMYWQGNATRLGSSSEDELITRNFARWLGIGGGGGGGGGGRVASTDEDFRRARLLKFDTVEDKVD